MTEQVVAGHRKMAATFVRNSSRGSSIGDKLGLSNRSSYNSLHDTTAGMPNPNQLMELIKNSRRASNSSLGNSVTERKKGMVPNLSCSSLSDLSSADSTNLQSRDSLSRMINIKLKKSEEVEENLPVESPKAILSQPFRGLIGMMAMNKLLTN